MFGIGSTELLLILIVALLVLVPKSLASTARSVGKVVGQFRRVSTDFQRTLNAEVAMEEEKEKRDKAAKEVEADLQQPAPQTVGQPDNQTGSQTDGQGASEAGAQAATAAGGAAATDVNNEDDSFSPPPGSPLDEALKKTAAEAANAAELMEPVTVETAQSGQVEQATPDVQGQQAMQNRA